MLFLETYISSLAGKIVGVIGHRGWVDSEQENMFHFTVNTRSSARLLQQTKLSPGRIIIAEIAFVRITLAWITGIILLIATILGVRFALIMHALSILFTLLGLFSIDNNGVCPFGTVPEGPTS